MADTTVTLKNATDSVRIIGHASQSANPIETETSGGVKKFEVGFNGLLTTHSGRIIDRISKANADTPYLTTVDDHYIGCDVSGGVLAVNLSTASLAAGRTVIIKDESGNASSNNITIGTEASETIDGSATLVLSGDYDSTTLVSDGTNWFVVV